MAAWNGWAVALLNRLGARPTPTNLQFLNAWHAGEQSTANFNPLNTTWQMPGAGSINSVGVRSYRSPQQGLLATTKTLLGNRGYDPIVQGLRAGNVAPAQLASRVVASPWGTKHFPTMNTGPVNMNSAAPSGGAGGSTRGTAAMPMPTPPRFTPPAAPSVMPFVNSMVQAMGPQGQGMTGITNAISNMRASTSNWASQLQGASQQYQSQLGEAQALAAQSAGDPIAMTKATNPPAQSYTAADSKARTGALAEAFYDPLGSWDSGRFGGAIGNHSDHVHLSITHPQAMLSAITKARTMGMRVGENPYIDPVDPVHVKGSFHYRDFPGTFSGKKLGEAIDVSGSPQQMAAYYRWAVGNLR